MPTRQQDVQNPHFQLPFRFGGINGGAFMNEQDSGEDIVDCVKAIIGFPVEAREDMPEFGIPDLLFRQSREVIIGQVRAALDRWEERAVIDVDGDFSLTDAALWDLLIQAGVSERG
jgi:hypothetical protein